MRLLAPITLFMTAALALTVIADDVGAARVDYVGAKRCTNCHTEQARAWQKGPHARAGESLGKRVGQQECQACHTTGDAPTGRPFFASVQCEACHGPGAGYAARDIMRNPTLSRRLGLVDLSTPVARGKVCARCHRATTRLAPFDAEAAWKRIRH